MELLDVMKYASAAFIPFFLKVIQAYHSNHFGHVKAKRDELALLKDVISDGIGNTPEQKLILEETLSQYYKKEISHKEFMILLNCLSPKKAIEVYLKYRYFLETCDSTGTFKYGKKPTLTLRLGKLFKWDIPVVSYRMFFGYTFFFLVGIFCMILSANGFQNATQRSDFIIYGVTSVFSPLFLLISIFFLNQGTNIMYGRKDLEDTLGGHNCKRLDLFLELRIARYKNTGLVTT